jgi:isocitrate dehydrogenase
MELAESRQLTRTAVAVAEGDGIGPEILAATMTVLDAAGARIDWQPIEVGEKVYRSGISSGITPQSWDVLRRTGLLLKAPITTPQGGGYKSLNVTIRKTLGLYANVRPCVTYHPFVDTRHPGMDVVIVRENEEDLYAGIEHRQTDEVYQCLKLISRPGCERIVRYAFEYARANGRSKVTCFSKDNIMKMTDGLFHKVFDEIGQQYPELEKEHRIVDIGAALLADDPGRFDVVVMPNLYGDILSDVAAQIAGSIGLAGSSNIGDHVAMFEAVHGSAPDIAGQDIANPSGLIQAAAMLLAHIGQGDVATRVQNAWLRTIEDGVHTADIAGPHTREKAGTRAFAQAVIARLGEKPAQLKPAQFAVSARNKPLPAPVAACKPVHKTLVGVDVFLHWKDGSPDALGAALNAAVSATLSLQMITNRGVKVWPGGLPETLCTDHWRCRFMPADVSTTIRHGDVVALLGKLASAGFDFIKTEHLYDFDGQPGYSLGQGQ